MKITKKAIKEYTKHYKISNKNYCDLYADIADCETDLKWSIVYEKAHDSLLWMEIQNKKDLVNFIYNTINS